MAQPIPIPSRLQARQALIDLGWRYSPRGKPDPSTGQSREKLRGHCIFSDHDAQASADYYWDEPEGWYVCFGCGAKHSSTQN